MLDDREGHHQAATPAAATTPLPPPQSQLPRKPKVKLNPNFCHKRSDCVNVNEVVSGFLRLQVAPSKPENSSSQSLEDWLGL
jgi:hypothetical protein